MDAPWNGPQLLSSAGELAAPRIAAEVLRVAPELVDETGRELVRVARAGIVLARRAIRIAGPTPELSSLWRARPEPGIDELASAISPSIVTILAFATGELASHGPRADLLGEVLARLEANIRSQDGREYALSRMASELVTEDVRSQVLSAPADDEVWALLAELTRGTGAPIDLDALPVVPDDGRGAGIAPELPAGEGAELPGGGLPGGGRPRVGAAPPEEFIRNPVPPPPTWAFPAPDARPPGSGDPEVRSLPPVSADPGVRARPPASASPGPAARPPTVAAPARDEPVAAAAPDAPAAPASPAAPAAPASPAAPAAGADDTERPRIYPVWFGTDRAPTNEDDLSAGFSNRRDPKERLHLGRCEVDVPRTHRFGEVGRPTWKRWLQFDFGDDDHLTLKRVEVFGSQAAFVADLRATLEKVGKRERVLVVYVHGYNSSFEDSAIRAAQIGFDLKVPGAMAFFSWPSKATVPDYPDDEATVETSEPAFVEFVTTLAKNSGATRVQLIAHSMGNRLLTRTALTLAAAGVHLDKLVLAAPDVDAQVFRRLAKDYRKLASRVVMYASAKDKALTASKFLHGYDRAGFMPPVTIVPRIDTIEVTDIDLTMLGHGYFAEAEPVLYDIKSYLDGQWNPAKRLRLTAVGTKPDRYWRIGK